MKFGRAMMMEAFRERNMQVRYPVYGSCPDKRFMKNTRNLRFGFMAFTDDSFVCLRLNRYIAAVIDETIEIPLSEMEILRMKRGWLQRRIVIRDKRTGKKIELGFCKKVIAGDFTEQMENSEQVWKCFKLLKDRSEYSRKSQMNQA